MDWQATSRKAFKRSLTELSFSGKCNNLSDSKTDFNTVEVYPTLNFKASLN